MRKLILLGFCLLGSSALAQERPTAYQALRVVGGRMGRDSVNHLIAVSGTSGDPQPASWKVLLEDPAARGGIRELEVENGRVNSERTPLRATIGADSVAIIDTAKLNLDSTGAYTVARHTAEKSGVHFDTVSYTLRSDERKNPVWTIRLEGAGRQPIGTIFVGANTGNIVRTEGLFGANAPIVTTEDGATNTDTDEDSDTNPIKATIKRVFRESRDDTKRLFRDLGRSFRDFYNGD